MTNLELRYVALAKKLTAQFPPAILDTMDYIPPNGAAPVYGAAATPANKAAIQAIIAAHDWTPRRPKPVPSLIQAIEGLPAPAEKTLTRKMLADWLRLNPQAAREEGIPLDGDEPDV